MVSEKQKFSAKQFIQSIQQQQDFFDSFSIEGDIVLDGIEVHRPITLYNVYINGDLTLKNSKFHAGIKFINTEIDGTLTIDHSEIGGEKDTNEDSKSLLWTGLKVNVEFHIKDSKFTDPISIIDSKLGTLEIHNTKFNSDLGLHRSQVVDEMLIEKSEIEVLNLLNCKFQYDIELTSIKSKHVHFYGNKVGEECTLRKLEVTDSIILENNTFSESLELTETKQSTLSVIQNKVDGELLIKDQTCHLLEFEENEVAKTVELYRLSVEKEISISECEFKSHLHISGIQSPKLILEGNSSTRESNLSLDDENSDSSSFLGKVDKIEIINGRYDRSLLLDLDKHLLSELFISSSPSSSGPIIVERGKTKKFILEGFNQNGHIYIYRTLVGFIHLKAFSNEGQLTFSQVRLLKDGKSRLRITKSSLGKTRFINMDMSLFGIIDIYDSFLEDIKYSNVTWFDKNQLNIPKDGLSKEQKEIYIGQKREVYRQLKYAAEKQGDRPQALAFKANEFTIYHQLLDLRIDQAKNNKWQLRGEKWSLQLGLFTNRLGQNWLRPLIQIIVITFIAYPLFIIAALPELTWWPIGNKIAFGDAMSEMWHLLGVLPQLFNPVRSLAKVFELENLPRIIYLWDTIHRIILTFYIYQIITAFRKYFK